MHHISWPEPVILDWYDHYDEGRAMHKYYQAKVAGAMLPHDNFLN